MTAELEELFRWARIHGELTDTTSRVDDLETMLRVAWEVMNETQRAAFAGHADVLSVAEAGGATWTTDESTDLPPGV